MTVIPEKRPIESCDFGGDPLRSMMETVALDPWNLIALVLVPPFLLSIAVLLSWLESVSGIIAPFRDAAVVQRQLAKDYSLHWLQHDRKWETVLRRLHQDVLEQVRPETHLLVHPWVVEMIDQGSGSSAWKEELVACRDKVEAELVSRLASAMPTLSARELGKWRRRARLKYRWYVVRHVVWPGYQALLGRSAKAALHLGALGFLGATLYWFVASSIAAPPDFIACIGNGSAFAGFLGLSVPVIIDACMLVWVRPNPGELEQSRARRRVAACVLGGLGFAFLPVLLPGVPEKFSSWLADRHFEAAGLPLLAVTAGVLILLPLVRDVTYFAARRPEVTVRSLLQRCYRVPLALLVTLMLWGPESLPVGFIWALLLCPMVIWIGSVVADIFDTKRLNHNLDPSVGKVPYSASTVRAAAGLAFGVLSLVSIFVVNAAPEWSAFPIYVCWFVATCGAYCVAQRALRRSALLRSDLIVSNAAAKRRRFEVGH